MTRISWRSLVHASELAPAERVLEVGPGTGTLTEARLDAEKGRTLAQSIRDAIGDRSFEACLAPRRV
jgi:phospholipid N-methyltransferase